MIDGATHRVVTMGALGTRYQSADWHNEPPRPDATAPATWGRRRLPSFGIQLNTPGASLPARLRCCLQPLAVGGIDTAQPNCCRNSGLGHCGRSVFPLEFVRILEKCSICARICVETFESVPNPLASPSNGFNGFNRALPPVSPHFFRGFGP